MNFKENENRIWLEDETGKKVALVDFEEVKEGVIELTHTEVDESLRGQGIAGKLMEAFVAKLEKEGKKTIPSCPYAAKWFKDHAEHDSKVEK